MLHSDYIHISAPIYVPLIISLGFDPLWFSVLFIVNLQMAFMTPPYGFALFYMKAIAPKGTLMPEIWRSAIPFVIMQMIVLILIMIFPQFALLLPHLIFR